jgi:hypothetical protein
MALCQALQCLADAGQQGAVAGQGAVEIGDEVAKAEGSAAGDGDLKHG